MGLSKVTINVGSGGIGRRALNEDKISGIVFYNDTLPSGFGASDREKKVFSLAEAEALGIAEGSVNHAVEWYHISEYFRLNPEGELWIGIYAVPGTGLIGDYTYTEVDTLQRAASGEIRQMAVYTTSYAYNISELSDIQTVVDGLITDGMPVSVLYAADMAAIVAVTGWATVGDARTLTAEHVTPVAGQDGGGAGKTLYDSKGYSITCIGAALGAISAAAVNQSIGQPALFNASNGTELEVAALANGDLVSALTDTALGGIKDDGYVIVRKYQPKLSGTYFERTPTSVVSTDDFAWQELVRTVDKATRLVDAALTPQLNATVLLNADGTMSKDTAAYFEDLAKQELDGMKSDGEISDYDATVDPTQDVNATSTVVITVKILPTGTAEFITVNIGLTNAI
jgi:hypothetical protein